MIEKNSSRWCPHRFLGDFFSMKIWIPLAYLSYNAYLVHYPFVQNIVLPEIATNLTVQFIFTFAVLGLALTQLVAVVVYLLVERPFNMARSVWN